MAFEQIAKLGKQVAPVDKAGVRSAFTVPFLPDTLVQDNVPEGDAWAFVERHPRPSQIELLNATFSVSAEFANEFVPAKASILKL